jgi:hypothetical protein
LNDLHFFHKFVQRVKRDKWWCLLQVSSS